MTPSEISHEIAHRLESNSLRLPSAPDVIVKMNSLVNDETKGLSDVARAIQKYQTLSARILQVVNSAALRPVKPVTSMNEALVILGMSLVRNLAIAIAIRDMFKSSNAELNKKLNDIWQHSVRVGALSSILVSKLDDKRYDSQTALTIGILHSIGALPVIDYFGEKRSTEHLDGVLEELTTPVSVFLLKHWNLPGSFIQAINKEPCLYGEVLGFVQAFLSGAPESDTKPFSMSYADFENTVKEKESEYNELISILS